MMQSKQLSLLREADPVLCRLFKNAMWCRKFAHSHRLDGNLGQFRIWMRVAHKSIGSCRRLRNSGAYANG